MRVILTTFVAALIIYLVYALLLFIFQRSVIYPGQYRQAAVSGINTSKFVSILWLRHSFGRTEAWLISPENVETINRPVMILAHGNFELIEDCFEEAVYYSQIGMNVLLVEYPGFGNSEGKPTYDNLLTVFKAAYDWIKSQDEFKRSQVIAYGRSLGGGPVCALAIHRHLDALILQSAFSDIRKFANQYFLPGFLIRDPFNNAGVLLAYDQPVLIMHGIMDQTIPFAHGQELQAATPGSRLIEYRCGHNDFPVFSAEHVSHIKKFLMDNKIIDQ